MPTITPHPSTRSGHRPRRRLIRELPASLQPANRLARIVNHREDTPQVKSPRLTELREDDAANLLMPQLKHKWRFSRSAPLPLLGRLQRTKSRGWG